MSLVSFLMGFQLKQELIHYSGPMFSGACKGITFICSTSACASFIFYIYNHLHSCCHNLFS